MCTHCSHKVSGLLTFSEGLCTVTAISPQCSREQPSAATLEGPVTNWFLTRVQCVVVVSLLIIYFRKQVSWIRKMGLVHYYSGTVKTKGLYPTREMPKRCQMPSEKQNNSNNDSEKRV